MLSQSHHLSQNQTVGGVTCVLWWFNAKHLQSEASIWKCLWRSVQTLMFFRSIKWKACVLWIWLLVMDERRRGCRIEWKWTTCVSAQWTGSRFTKALWLVLALISLKKHSGGFSEVVWKTSRSTVWHMGDETQICPCPNHSESMDYCLSESQLYLNSSLMVNEGDVGHQRSDHSKLKCLWLLSEYSVHDIEFPRS